AIAAEAMAIAWRRLADVPRDDPRPWLIATARNLVLADRRRYAAVLQDLKGVEPAAPPQTAILELDHELEVALATLSDTDREALLLVAWEDLTPSAASVRPDRRLPRRCPARPSPPAAHRHAWAG